MKFCQIPVSTSEWREIDDEKLRTKRGNQSPLHSTMTVSDMVSQPPHVREFGIIAELRGQFIPLFLPHAY